MTPEEQHLAQVERQIIAADIRMSRFIMTIERAAQSGQDTSEAERTLEDFR